MIWLGFIFPSELIWTVKTWIHQICTVSCCNSSLTKGTNAAVCCVPVCTILWSSCASLCAIHSPPYEKQPSQLLWMIMTHHFQNIYRRIWRTGPAWDVTGPAEPGAVSGCYRQIFSGPKLWSLCARCRFASSKGHQSGVNCEIIEIHWAPLPADRTIRTCSRDAEERRPQVCPGVCIDSR